MVYKNSVMDGNVQLKRKWPDFVMIAKKTRTNEDHLEMDQKNSYTVRLGRISYDEWY